MEQTLCELRNLSKTYGTVQAVVAVTLELRRGELISIVGPSGAGKTTLLRLLAELETADSGEIRFHEPPSREHPVVLVFQDFLLFPSMTVAANVAFGLRARSLPRRETQERVLYLLTAFGIEDKAHEYPAQLSAGQQQRVALARALAIRPHILLLDEPFAHLDKTLKMDTALFLRRMLHEFGITAVAVTHDLEEAFVMSDRVGIMIDGRLRQLGPVDEVYSRPASLDAARFLGPVSRFPAAMLHAMERSAAIEDLLQQAHSKLAAPDTPLYCRAESLAIVPDVSGNAVIEEVRFVGMLVLYVVRLRYRDLETSLNVFSLENGLEPGSRVRVRVTQVCVEEYLGCNED